jgi:PAS domain S-box-containing protein
MALIIIKADREGNIIAAEGDVEAILGWDPEGLLGKPVVEIIPFKYRERHAAGWERWCTTGQKMAMGTWMKAEARRADGNEISIDLCITEREGIVQAIIGFPADPGLPTFDD